MALSAFIKPVGVQLDRAKDVSRRMNNEGNQSTRRNSNRNTSPHHHSEAVPPDVLAAILESFGDDLPGKVAERVLALINESVPLKPLLTVKDVSRTLKISERTVETLIGAGKLRPLWVGGQRRFHPDTITDYLRTLEGARRPRRRRVK